MKSTPARTAKTRRWWRAFRLTRKLPGVTLKKDVRHIEIDLGDSGLRYQPGDALGVWYQNDPALVKELVELLWLKGDEPVTVDGKTLTLSEALQWHFELTVNTANIVENYATLTRSETLLPLVGDKAKLQHYAATTPIVDMVRFSPAQLDAEALINPAAPADPAPVFHRLLAGGSRERSTRHRWRGALRRGRPRPCRWCLQLPLRTAWKKRAKSAYLSNITTTSACQPTQKPR